MFGPIKAVVFDFDGTLVDTMTSVIEGLGGVVEQMTGRKVPHDELLASFGPSPSDVLSKWLAPQQVPAAFNLWIEFEKKMTPADMRPFEGVEEMLAGLKKAGLPIGIFTGRDRAGCLRIAGAHGWVGKYFDEGAMVCGDDGLPHKPRPEALVALAERMKLEAASTLMVGDHVYDMMAGREAGYKTAAAMWDLPPGQGTHRSRYREAWTKWDSVSVDLRLESPRSLLRWIAG